MPSPTLQDQMGAMALIDELRQRRMNLQQHMNLPLHRTEVATKIRDYYLNQNIIVGDDVIDAGVRAYFDRRLRFDAPQLTGWRYRIADMWIRRRKLSMKMIMPAIYCACAAVAAGTAINYATGYIERKEIAQGESLSVAQQSLARKIDAQKKATSDAILRHPELPSVKRIGNEALSLIEQAGQSSQQVAVLLVETKNKADNAAHDLSRDRISTATRLLDSAAFLTQQMESLAAAYQAVVRLDNDPAYQRRRAERPEIASASAAVKTALEEADSGSAGLAISVAADVMRNAHVRGPGASPSQQAADILAEFQTMGISRPALADLTGKVAAVANAGSEDAARKSVKELEHMLAFARTPLRAKVLHRRYQLTGDIERATGGSDNFFGRVQAGASGFDALAGSVANARRSAENPATVYALYAEMVDGSGKSYPLPMKSEGGKAIDWAPTFGLEVSAQMFDKVRRDKESDGKIDAPFIGEKPANSLDIKFFEGVPSNPYIFNHGQ